MKISIQDITLTGIFAAISITVGIFGQFKIGGSGIFLIGIPIFISVIFLKLPLALISASISLVIADLWGAYISHTWISLVSYLPALVIVWAFSKLKLKFLFFIGLIIASGYIILMYYILERIAFGTGYAVKDIIPNVIQFSIILGTVSILYYPALLFERSVLYES